jgi:MoaA/NifB/PqqE/SkfB family radical SAM enzyme
MKQHSWPGEPQQRTLRQVFERRLGWFMDGLSPGKSLNLAACATDYLFRREVARGLPVVLKIDVSPACNLQCPTCIHGDPRGNPALGSQRFNSGQGMRPSELERIVSQVKGRAMAASLHFLGDPLIHPEIDELCRVARNGLLNVHLCSSFSFELSDARLKSLLESGVTHLTVCVDGMTQESYGRTRAGGRIDLVLSNLERACAYKREAGLRYPQIEVQYIMFQHNVDEMDAAYRRFEEIGVDEATAFWGFLHNYVDIDPGTYAVHGPRPPRRLPRCYWPYFFMVIKQNGDVIPCCNHRVGEQNSAAVEQKILGNVFEAGVRGVWNSAAYREARRLVLSPPRIETESGLRGSFCDECPRLFDTGRDENLRSAQHYAFEDLYTTGADGVARKIGTPEDETEEPAESSLKPAAVA